MSNTLLRIYNSQIYNNPYVKKDKLKMVLPKYYYSPLKGKNIELVRKTVESCGSIVLGHGSIIKAELFNDPDKFVPLSIQYLLETYEKGPIIINSLLINQVLETMKFPNNTGYMLVSGYRLLRFLVVNKGKYSYLTYN